MSDEQDGEAHILLQAFQQLHDLRLDGDIQRCGRLIGDQQLWPADDGHGDHHALTQAAGQLMRILLQAALGIADADLFQGIDDERFRLREIHAAVQAKAFSDLAPNAKGGIEAGHRLLENHADTVAANLLHPREAHRDQVFALKHHAACFDARGRRWQQPHDGLRCHTLAATGFAHQAQHLAGFEFKAHILDDAGITLFRIEADRQALDAEQRCIAHSKTRRGK